MKNVRRIFATGIVAVIVGWVTPTVTFGDIVLNVDTTNKEFFFSGFDSGTLASGGNNSVDGYASWNSSSSGPRFNVSVVSDVLWSGPSDPGPGSIEPGNEVQLSGGLFIYFLVPGGGVGDNTSAPGESGTFSFVGNRFSYAAASDSQQDTLEHYATNGLTIAPSGSSIGFQHLRVSEFRSVPEPGFATWIVAAFGTVLFCRRRK